MKKIILSLAVVAFIAAGTVSVNASTLIQDPVKKEEKKATIVADNKECCSTAKKEENKAIKAADKKECYSITKTCCDKESGDIKGTTKKKKKL
ncbi:MAG: hypothetical protein GY834_05730 [Bacteroidetes bacterium]|nr:hypothetical protein [Bacteroidota bacterium]